MDWSNKLNYLKISTLKFLINQGFNCPNCGNSKNKIIKRKYFVTTLRECQKCFLLFRAPTTTTEENKKFYQEKYSIGYATDCPNEEELKKLIDTNFNNTERSYKKYIEILKLMHQDKNPKLLDFGCSWGYGSYQLSKSGFDIESYEISESRSRYAKEMLNVKIIDNLNSIEDEYFDIFFSSHVLEHLPNLNYILNLALRIIKKNGLFIAFTPNGSFFHKNKNSHWNKLWGMVHPNFLNEKFYKNYFKDYKHYISSQPYSIDSIKNFINGDQNFCDNLEGEELLIIVKNKQLLS